MKRLLVIMSALLAIFAFAAPSAFAQAYPPGAPLLLASSHTPAAGSPVTFTAEGFAPGDCVIFTYSLVPGSNSAAVITPKLATSGTLGPCTVADANGTATLVADAPTLAGTFTIVATGVNGVSASTTITILAISSLPLPATGSDISGTTLTAGVLVLLGAGLVGGVAIRRRSRALTH